jgi:hypothetical protein
MLYCAMPTKLSIQLLINAAFLKSFRYSKVTSTKNLRGIIWKRLQVEWLGLKITILDAEKNITNYI